MEGKRERRLSVFSTAPRSVLEIKGRLKVEAGVRADLPDKAFSISNTPVQSHVRHEESSGNIVTMHKSGVGFWA